MGCSSCYTSNNRRVTLVIDAVIIQEWRNNEKLGNMYFAFEILCKNIFVKSYGITRFRKDLCKTFFSKSYGTTHSEKVMQQHIFIKAYNNMVIGLTSYAKTHL